MFGKSISALVAKSFGISTMYYPQDVVVLDNDSREIGKAKIEYGWLCLVRHYRKPWIFVSRIHCSQYLEEQNTDRVCLLVHAPYLKQEQEYVGSHPFRSFQVPYGDDIVAKALQSINLVEPPQVAEAPSSNVPVIEMEIIHPHGVREIKSDSQPELEASWQRLFSAVVETMHQVAPLYGDRALMVELTKPAMI